MTPKLPRRLFLVDGYALIYRAFFAMISRPLTTSSGENTSAPFGIARFLVRLIDDHDTDYVGFVLDAGDSYRTEVYPEYKATREKMPEEMVDSLPGIREIVDAWRIPVFMKEGFEAVGGQIDLSQFAVPGFRGLLIYTGIGIAATVIMQSSHATLILAITALAADQVTYQNALALAIGSNVGTTITAILGSMSSNVQGKRLAAAHLIFNAVTALIAIVFIYQIGQGVNLISAWVGIADDDYTLKLAVFHTDSKVSTGSSCGTRPSLALTALVDTSWPSSSVTCALKK